MSVILVPDIHAIASARLGSQFAQRSAAIPRRASPLDRYQPLRDEWGHGFYPHLDARLGQLTPQQAAIARAIEQLVAPEHQAAAASLVGLPPPAARAPGLRPAQPAQPPTQPQPTPPTEQHTLLDTGGVLSARAEFVDAQPNAGTRFFEAVPIALPILVTGIAWHATPHGSPQLRFAVRVAAIGFNLSAVNTNVAEAFADGSLPTHILARDGITLEAETEVMIKPGAPQTGGISAHVSYRNVAGLRARSSSAAAPGAAPGEELPCEPIQTWVLDALHGSGVPDEWLRTCP